MVYLLVQFKQKGISVADAKTMNEAMVPMINESTDIVFFSHRKHG